jgi:hypothetical protein
LLEKKQKDGMLLDMILMGKILENFWKVLKKLDKKIKTVIIIIEISTVFTIYLKNLGVEEDRSMGFTFPKV